jgi:dihydrofolate reductase
MGRETLESFPGKQPLKNRVNIVLSRSMTNADNLVVCHSIEQLIESLKGYADKEVFVIGGQSVYTQLLPYCDTVYVTKINNTHEADRYFPNLDEMEEWVVAEESEVKSYNDTEFKFVTYVRK